MTSNQLRAPNHPGKILRELYMKPLGLSVSTLASHLQVSRKTLSKIINTRGAINPEMALRLANAFDTSPNLWLNLQQNYDLWHTQKRFKSWKDVKRISSQLVLCQL